MKKFISIIILLFLFVSATNAATFLVKNIAEFNASLQKLKPGDTLKMANGTWKDVQLVFKGEGTEGSPIVLIAETPGKVSIEGKSSLTLVGNYLQVFGLLFTNGYSPSDAAISFAADHTNPSNHCRVSNCAVIDFNKPERFDSDSWVAIYGKHNRFDHNYLAGKLNSGVTVAIYLNDVKNQDNHHQIDHNYFGERKRLGSNGGETMRLGTSTYSLVSSNTTIEDNYFEHCNGEVEALSIKSTDNIFRRNTFFECEGSFVLRHGNNNQVYENIFIGNGKVTTGGLRIINAGHDVHDNYFFKVTGERFRSALAVMNGVPNSAINRYHQVKDAKIYNNTFIDCDNILFGVGSDNERTACPINTTFTDNTIYQPNSSTPVSFLSDVSGIEFKGNRIFAPKMEKQIPGFNEEEMHLEKDKSGFYQAVKGKEKKEITVSNINADDLAQKQNAGPDWLKSYAPAPKVPAKKTEASNDAGMLENAVREANPGDTIVLVSGGVYTLSETLAVDKLLYIQAADGLKQRPELIFNDDKDTRQAHILLKNGGNLSVKGIAFNGTTEAGNKATAGIKTDKRGMIKPYWLRVEDCAFYNFNESNYSAFKAEKGSYADSLIFSNCLFHTISGDAISVSAEKDDRGIYNAEYVFLDNCIFFNIMGSALDLYRGGNDESTLGPYLTVDHCLFENVNNKELGSVIRVIGVQNVDIRNCIFSNSGSGGRSIKFEETRWDHCTVSNCSLYNSGRIESFYNNVAQGKMYEIEPIYVNQEAFDFHLKNAKEFEKENIIGPVYK